MANEEYIDKNQDVHKDVVCSSCGAKLSFNPGSTSLKCGHCGAENTIEVSTEVIEEVDFEKFIAGDLNKEEKLELIVVKCGGCGASVTLKPNVTSDNCPYCDTSLVVQNGSSSSILRPKSLLPFKVELKSAVELFRKWVKSLWFAPNALIKRAATLDADKLKGMYIPYWTYDSNTDCNYTGLRGDYYYTTESYTTTENGQTVTKTRQVRHTRWTPAFGRVYNNFDDVLVVASKSLPTKYMDKLEPWDLANLVPFNEKFLSGFQAESYQVDLKEGFGVAKGKMEPIIRESVRRDIGGDEQQITTLNVAYNDVTFKHLLLPVWISAYRFKDKVFRFIVNARTGEVQGERPYSFWKIFFTSLFSAAAIGAIIYFIMKANE